MLVFLRFTPHHLQLLGIQTEVLRNEVANTSSFCSKSLLPIGVISCCSSAVLHSVGSIRAKPIEGTTFKSSGNPETSNLMEVRSGDTADNAR